MKQLWTKELVSDQAWEPNYQGVFSKDQNGNVAFYYLNGNHVMRAEECGVSVAGEAPKEYAIPLPAHWIVTKEKNSTYLLCADQMAVNLENGATVFPMPQELQAAYQQEAVRPKYYEEASYRFGEYEVQHKGEWGYLCKAGKQKIWEFNGRGYLYTDIRKWQDRIFFGTAGCGGYFYILDLQSGTPIMTLRTGGTTVIGQNHSLCYLFQCGTKPQLLCVDLTQGRVVDSIILPGKATDYSALTYADGHIYTVTFRYCRGELCGAFLNCVECV